MGVLELTLLWWLDLAAFAAFLDDDKESSGLHRIKKIYTGLLRKCFVQTFKSILRIKPRMAARLGLHCRLHRHHRQLQTDKGDFPRTIIRKAGTHRQNWQGQDGQKSKLWSGRQPWRLF